MITSLSIQGIRRFGPEPLTMSLRPITVLVGPNGAGKSTVLDSLLIAGAKHPQEAIGRAIRRRIGLNQAARWFLHSSEVGEGSGSIAANYSDGTSLDLSITRADLDAGNLRKQLAERTKRRPEMDELTTLLVAGTHSSGSQVAGKTLFDASNSYTCDHRGPAIPVPGAWLLDTNLIRDDESEVATLFSELARKDASIEDQIAEILRSSVPALSGLTRLRILANPPGKPYLAFGNGKGGLLPIAVIGDGGRLLLQIALSAENTSSGTLLIEEPELHQHPAAIHRLARMLIELPKRGIQVVISTHSPTLLSAMRIAGQRSPETSALADVGIIAFSIDVGRTTLHTIAGESELTVGWTDFARAHLPAFDPSFGGL